VCISTCVATDCRLIGLEKKETWTEEEKRAKIEGPGSSNANDEKMTTNNEQKEIRQEYDQQDKSCSFFPDLDNCFCSLVFALPGVCFSSVLYNLYTGTVSSQAPQEKLAPAMPLARYKQPCDI